MINFLSELDTWIRKPNPNINVRMIGKNTLSYKAGNNVHFKHDNKTIVG